MSNKGKLTSKFRPEVAHPVEEKLMTHEGLELPVDPSISEFLDEDIRARHKVPPTETPFILTVEDLKMHFPVTKGLLKRQVGSVKAVDGVSFQLRQGETLGIVGESGSGKSTVGNCVMRNLNPTGGKIMFDGADVTRIKGKALDDFHRKLTMVTQDPFASLDPRMRIQDSILEGVRINKLVSGRQEQADLVARLLTLVGLNPKFAERYPHEFSGGQRQRISIARALALNPAFIVCDEIVSALDVSIQAQIVSLMMKLQEELGLTYIFIGHDLSVVRHLSNNVAVMYLGKFMELTSSDELYQKPLHPYTQALISAAPIPKPKVDRERKRILLEGEVPSPINPPKGCNFCTRCRYADARCREEEPKLVDVGGGHMVACHKVCGK
ncbi:MAG: ATP-binding cassette domain-containing protein [Oscillospiraceae bacterium]|nr:ATP-binding cassette domain-containing protein [Oscillospiraceae bacterium]